LPHTCAACSAARPMPAPSIQRHCDWIRALLRAARVIRALR
jgi:hypothetical protein